MSIQHNASTALLRCLIIAGTALLAGCFHGSSDSDDETSSAYIRDVVIQSSTPSTSPNTPDTVTRLTATVFLPPDYYAGKTFPLIIHSHSWGSSRFSATDAEETELAGADSPENYVSLIDRQVLALREAGYVVISYDQRGFGRGDDGDDGSTDGSHGMSPEFEIEDAKAVLDWAMSNLALKEETPGDPLVGLLGSSYSGAFQLMLAAEDPRVDAVVPSTTWFNLADALAPNRTLKKGWLLLICQVAVQADNAELAAEIEQACAQASETSARELGDAPLAENIFFDNGLSAYAGQPEFSMPAVDALILHGTRDTLFNQNQGEAIFNYLRQAGGDVNLLLHETGHSLRVIRNGPGSQGPLGQAYCGSIDTVLVIRQWLDWKLQGGAAPALPEICLALDNREAVHLSSIPRGTTDNRVSFAKPVSAAQNNTDSAAGSAHFIALEKIDDANHVLAGIPVARVTVEAELLSNSDPTPVLSGPNTAGVFIGVGIERNGQRFLVDGQVQPILSSDERADVTPEPIELVGVAERLQPGDRVGILLYGKFDQYENHLYSGTGTNWDGNAAVVSGSVDLPIIVPEATDRRP